MFFDRIIERCRNQHKQLPSQVHHYCYWILSDTAQYNVSTGRGKWASNWTIQSGRRVWLAAALLGSDTLHQEFLSRAHIICSHLRRGDVWCASVHSLSLSLTLTLLHRDTSESDMSGRAFCVGSNFAVHSNILCPSSSSWATSWRHAKEYPSNSVINKGQPPGALSKAPYCRLVTTNEQNTGPLISAEIPRNKKES